MFGTRKKIEELELLKMKLTASNMELREKIDEVKEFTSFADKLYASGKNHSHRGGVYGTIRNLPDFQTKWKDTVFWKYREELEYMNTECIKYLPERDFLGSDLINPKWGFEYEFDLLAYCDIVMPTPQGPIIHVFDPFGEYTFAPAKMVPNLDAQNSIGTIVLVHCVMRYYQKDYEVLGLKKLNYTLQEKIGA